MKRIGVFVVFAQGVDYHQLSLLKGRSTVLFGSALFMRTPFHQHYHHYGTRISLPQTPFSLLPLLLPLPPPSSKQQVDRSIKSSRTVRSKQEKPIRIFRGCCSISHVSKRQSKSLSFTIIVNLNTVIHPSRCLLSYTHTLLLERERKLGNGK